MTHLMRGPIRTRHRWCFWPTTRAIACCGRAQRRIPATSARRAHLYTHASLELAGLPGRLWEIKFPISQSFEAVVWGKPHAMANISGRNDAGGLWRLGGAEGMAFSSTGDGLDLVRDGQPSGTILIPSRPFYPTGSRFVGTSVLYHSIMAQ